jgi:tripartite ATP-independent transporter DctP family solute receptor
MLQFDRRAALLGGGSLALVGTAVAQTPTVADQFHNQPADSPLDRALKAIWERVRTETKGQLQVTVHPLNNGIEGSDPAALKMLISGELQFYTLMGGILSQAVPVMDVQGLPYVFKTRKQVFDADNGALGHYLDAECTAKGIHRLRGGLLDNGFRQVNAVDRRIEQVSDMADLSVRVPDGAMFRDFFTTIGAKPVTLNINRLYDALKKGDVAAQENPLVIIETNKLYEVTKHVSMTNHMWSGFNLLCNLKFWNSLPPSTRRSINRAVSSVVPRQRTESEKLNNDLRQSLAARGMTFTEPNTNSFKAALGASFYRRWQDQLGSKAWKLLEASVGPVRERT